MSHECIVMKKSLQNHMFMLNRKIILNTVFMYHIMENIIILRYENEKKKSLNQKTLMVVAFKWCSGNVSFIQIHLL